MTSIKFNALVKPPLALAPRPNPTEYPDQYVSLFFSLVPGLNEVNLEKLS